jgi:Uma2 family endonuclease
MVLVRAKWSIQDYHQMVETGLLDDRHVELLRGEIIEMSPEGAPHSSYCGETVKYLRRLLGDLAEVREAHPVTLPNSSEPESDIAIVKVSPTFYRARLPQVEDIFWLIEVANSTLAIDLGIKQEIYAAAGIQEYWVMNLRESVLVVFRNLTTAGYQSETSFTSGTISPLAFADISIDIQQLFT